MTKDELIDYAQENGVEVHYTMKKQEIEDAIKSAGLELPVADAGEAAKAKTAPVLLKADYWDETGARHKKGTVIDLTPTEARKLMEGGKADRADPLPGEET